MVQFGAKFLLFLDDPQVFLYILAFLSVRLSSKFGIAQISTYYLYICLAESFSFTMLVILCFCIVQAA